MPVLELECTIGAPLEEVWAFHQDVPRALAALSPPDSGVEVERAEPLPPRVGTRVVIRARDPFGRRIRWVAVYVEHQDPHPVPGGAAARFVDEQESGPFAAWRHEHDFSAIGESSTRLVDRVTYTVPLGPLGRIADRLFVARQLRQMFRHRHQVTRRTLGHA
jgi:ligand-binding SRPBCC domain-containing protein